MQQKLSKTDPYKYLNNLTVQLKMLWSKISMEPFVD